MKLGEGLRERKSGGFISNGGSGVDSDYWAI